MNLERVFTPSFYWLLLYVSSLSYAYNEDNAYFKYERFVVLLLIEFAQECKSLSVREFDRGGNNGVEILDKASKEACQPMKTSHITHTHRRERTLESVHRSSHEELHFFPMSVSLEGLWTPSFVVGIFVYGRGKLLLPAGCLHLSVDTHCDCTM
ncbi:hypothetical protein CR513_07612, partial [Mucuna pruriens]